MNLILFESSEIEQPLARKDRRAVHIIDVLRRKVGDSFDVGLVNGPRGKATLHDVRDDALALTFAWSTPQPELDPVTLIVGLPRPQTARDVLRDATTLGVAAIHFVRTERTEPSYSQSTLWSSGEWRRHLVTGAEQAFDTRIPEITHTRSLQDALAMLPGSDVRVALDNYEAAGRMGELKITAGNHQVLAIGGERGWSAADREFLRTHHFTFVHLGERVLRTETATVAALSILRTKLGLM